MAKEVAKATLIATFESDEVRDHAATIGAVASMWAYIEMQIDLGTADVLEIGNKEAACILSQVTGPARKLDTYLSAVHLKMGDAFVKELRKFSADTKLLAEKRNRFVHDSWNIVDGIGPARFEISARGKLKMGALPSPTSEVAYLLTQLNEHYIRQHALHRTIMASHPKSRETQ